MDHSVTFRKRICRSKLTAGHESGLVRLYILDTSRNPVLAEVKRLILMDPPRCWQISNQKVSE